MDYQVVVDLECEIGEGPVWHPLEKRVYWTDIVGKRLHWFDPTGDEHAPCNYDDQMVGGLTVQTDGSLLLFREHGNIVVWRDGEVRKTIVDKIDGAENHRFNDVWADPEGRVYCGTLGFDMEHGTLYRLDRDGSLTPLVEDVDVCNGMGLSPDGRRLYFTESLRRTIWQFDYDAATGDLSNRRPLVEVAESAGFPDGMAMDADGRVWSARWDGWCVTCVHPDGRDGKSIRLPAKQVSSVCFGGDDLTEMYVTSAGGDDRSANGEFAGALFRVNAGVRGATEHLSRIGI